MQHEDNSDKVTVEDDVQADNEGTVNALVINMVSFISDRHNLPPILYVV